MLPAERPRPAHETDSTPDHPARLSLVPSREEDQLVQEVSFETGLIRSLVIGGFVGFIAVFVLVCGGFLLAGIDVISSILSAAFVGAFGGVGFGAMEGASIHKPRPPKAS